MLGGRKTAEQDGLKLPLRDELYARICARPEGSLFTHADIVRTPDEADDFVALRNYDYVHVVDGYFTGIVESKFLRQIPREHLVVDAYKEMRDIVLVETGDRTAWKMGLKQWEPIQGYRYYTDGTDDLLSLGYMKIRIYHAPEWLRADTREASMFRIFYDQPAKDAAISMERARRVQGVSLEDLEAASDYGLAQDPTSLPNGWINPHDVCYRLRAFLKTVREARQ